ncbi:NAD(P)H-hydrate dehydratase [Lautropia mirabilis]|uniref:NAD(P)H-hydrate dehydratase n=1 Tax=Lautropia mirabilis TaxID=47671 RepID=UPI0023493956|nr:NAD(P)H-hydrate dehydratase [Lautropia mirabilis]MDC6093162.1 NAD(P)H-hydrate dehydratase [Lautropia mirabilis]
MKTRSITAAVRPALLQTPAWVLDLATIRRLEGRWLDETEPGELMACAGAAVARVAMAMWKNLPAHAPVILLVGPGNNGGDALVAGRILRRAGLAVWAAGMPGLDTTPPEAEDARAAWEAWRADGQVIHGFEQVADWLWPDGDAPDDEQDDGDGDVPPAEPALIIDGLFGIGLVRPLAGRVAELVRLVNRARVPVLAIDVPSGLDADRGAPVGDAEAPVMQARQTVTMIADKPGLHTGAGLRHAGRVWVAPLSDLPLEAELDVLEAADGPADAGEWHGVPTEAEAETDPDDGHNFDDSGMDAADADAPCPADEDSFPHDLPGVLLTAPLAAALLPARARDAHKGNGGDVLVVGGRLGMAGAARLAAQGAAGAGAGRVWIAVEEEDCPQDAPGKARQPVDPLHPEIMRFVWGADVALPGSAPVLVVGCGLGQDETAQQWLDHALSSQAPLVIDADALGLLTEAPAAPCSILTPHPLEAARLLGVSVADVQADRPVCACALAARFDAVAVLKGAGTVVAAPDGRLAINTSGHPVLATAGTGDVLAGTIAALLAGLLRAGCPPDEAAWQAACAGVWLHGRAGEYLARRQGPRGVPAGALPGQYPGIMGSLSMPASRRG